MLKRLLTTPVLFAAALACLLVAAARADIIYVSMPGNNTISKIAPNGTVSPFATVLNRTYWISLGQQRQSLRGRQR